MSTTSIITTHFVAAIVIFIAWVMSQRSYSGRAPRPRESPTRGLMAVQGIVTGSEPELMGPFSQQPCVAWRILTPGEETKWKSGPTDWAEAIAVRLDGGLHIRLVFTDVTLISAPPRIGTVPDGLDFGERAPRIGEYHDRTGHVREESIAVGDRVYVSGIFSCGSPDLDDPMRRGDTAGASPIWSVSIPTGRVQTRLHGGTFADFGVFGSQSRRHYRFALKATFPTFALYLAFALMAFGRLW